MNHLRNFCIIAHIDHGKSTLADRLLQITGTISEREMQAQVLDSMDLERERGVTIKASAVRMNYTARNGQAYIMNLIDTPGHVDFTYEVSRALKSCEGALLVVDASQGIEAQTLANLYLALDADLEIIPVINKIDLPAARPDEIAQELEDLLGIKKEKMIMVSAKTGLNVAEILEAVVERVPPPKGDPDAPLQALIFDSHYDSYKGVIAYVRVFSGTLKTRQPLRMIATGVEYEAVEFGAFSPTMQPLTQLSVGEVGYIATGLKTVRECRVGDTITLKNQPASEGLPGYSQAKPMVFAGVYPVDAEDYPALREALDRLQLNDAALVYEPENSQALNFGFRCGFLGLFHMDIVQERLEREYDLDILVTAPSVEYQVKLRNGDVVHVDSPAQMPDESHIIEVLEPWMKINVFMPDTYIGVVMELVTKRRGKYLSMEYLDKSRVNVSYLIPLAELIVDFYDRLKSGTKGYASLDYQFEGYHADKLVKMDILVNSIPVDALAMIVHRDDAQHKGQRLVSKLKELIPRQQFVIPLQAAIGGKIISRADVKAQRKDVLAKCYGGDITRKKKLLEKQKKGKRRLKMIGSVEVPQEAFMAVLKLDEED
ncbi:MAG TPA: translation elongation factor 4 [Aggregatilineales bacterium]|nr:elongation factor 4 [Anaerolineales bacterium]HRE49164.1 translation elongation factor 4 [Aggregatilineales bacterium]